jgi:hypothetical protein
MDGWSYYYSVVLLILGLCSDRRTQTFLMRQQIGLDYLQLEDIEKGKNIVRTAITNTNMESYFIFLSKNIHSKNN